MNDVFIMNRKIDGKIHVPAGLLSHRMNNFGDTQRRVYILKNL